MYFRTYKSRLCTSTSKQVTQSRKVGICLRYRVSCMVEREGLSALLISLGDGEVERLGLSYHTAAISQGVVTLLGLACRMISLLMGACVSFYKGGAKRTPDFFGRWRSGASRILVVDSSAEWICHFTQSRKVEVTDPLS
jgi:hypothetical protein